MVVLHDVRTSRSVLGDALANATYDVSDVAVTRTLVSAAVTAPIALRA